ncbi:pyridoxamine 5'-phosphate oxidase family protein [Desulfofustis limnaeus]|jgi:hypothetical protein|uniref:Pyridoxamine 5'-phosphate oxidase N-terminal domain-containing protein n=1 Tax=Desulfofustis limnaeus TaxID=2740163 RepID=A0ABN6M1U8_9BACT|nr:pyridoxamine 5'-phosphate oxidase family protein [Desulfofustis limnaeus]MDX9896923.1 pyridoxamine 5'-phosphate oxidase family protein [Desulfofustis sp.]BDD85974.1 hypothetical protein DPPLL_03390 [Desulfofustis limnaeus]
MQMQEQQLRDQIGTLLASQSLAVLGTQREGQPYSSLMAFAHSDDLRTIVVATGQATRKYANIERDPRVSLFFDNRTNTSADFHRATALTALGVAAECGVGECTELWERYLRRHPYLQSFLRAPATSLLAITIHHYLLVSRFQQVMELHLGDERDLFSR